VPAQSKAWVSGRSLAGIAGSNLAGKWMSVACECYVFSGTNLCDGPSVVCLSVIEEPPRGSPGLLWLKKIG
jgi:hypothetical protein